MPLTTAFLSFFESFAVVKSNQIPDYGDFKFQNLKKRRAGAIYALSSFIASWPTTALRVEDSWRAKPKTYG
jgi:hypothetical protein